MIWKDIDQDGIQDDGEEGVADVNITALQLIQWGAWNRYYR